MRLIGMHASAHGCHGHRCALLNHRGEWGRTSPLRSTGTTSRWFSSKSRLFERSGRATAPLDWSVHWAARVKFPLQCRLFEKMFDEIGGLRGIRWRIDGLDPHIPLEQIAAAY